MIYIWFTGVNYYKLAFEKDRDSYDHYNHMETRLKDSCLITEHRVSFGLIPKFPVGGNWSTSNPRLSVKH